MTAKYLCSLIAGAAISLALLLVASDLTAPAAAVPITEPDDVFAVFGPLPAAPLIAAAEPYDDGIVLPAGGAFVTCPTVETLKPAVSHQHRLVYRARDSTWWTRGPVRRIVSWPIRAVIARRRCR